MGLGKLTLAPEGGPPPPPMPPSGNNLRGNATATHNSSSSNSAGGGGGEGASPALLGLKLSRNGLGAGAAAALARMLSRNTTLLHMSLDGNPSLCVDPGAATDLMAGLGSQVKDKSWIRIG